MANIQSLELRVAVDTKQLKELGIEFSVMGKSAKNAAEKIEKDFCGNLEECFKRLKSRVDELKKSMSGVGRGEETVFDPHSPIPYNSIMNEEHNANEKTDTKPEKVCANCGYMGTKRDFSQFPSLFFQILEIVLWTSTIILFIVDVVVGSIFIFFAFWISVLRRAEQFKQCPICKAKNPIPADSPRGRELMKESSKEN